MVIDDEPIVGKRLKGLLKKEGFYIEIFSDSKDAVSAIEKRGFDIIISDLKMEGYDGLQIMDIAKKTNPDIIVIIITGFVQKSTETTALENGAFDFIIKPFKVEHLRNTINRAVLEITKRSEA